MTIFRSFCVLILLLFSVGALSEDEPPKATHDGLQLLKKTRSSAVYGKPGADLSEYDKVALLEAYVAFKKRWQRNYNEQVDMEHQVRDKDIKRIRSDLAKEFAKVFADVLSTKGGHELVGEGGPGVLVIRPAIVNLEITAPDTMVAGMDSMYAGNAGDMTLYMELYDGASGAILYRIVDAEAAGNDMWRVRNRVTNRADADRVLRKWAETLNSHLAGAKPSS